jgi:predicted DNA repair protein MutK
VSGGEGELDASLSLTVVSLAAAAAGAAAIIVTLGRVGWRKTRLSDRVLHIGAWLVFAWPAIGTLNPATTWGQRAVTLPLAIAALVVARAHLRQHAGDAPRPRVIRAPVTH